jgi:hypothetical protein
MDTVVEIVDIIVRLVDAQGPGSAQTLLRVMGSVSKLLRERVVLFLTGSVSVRYSEVLDALIEDPHALSSSSYRLFGMLNVTCAASLASASVPRSRLRSGALVYPCIPAGLPDLAGLAAPAWSARKIASVSLVVHADILRDIRLCADRLPGLLDFHLVLASPVSPNVPVTIRFPPTVHTASLAKHDRLSGSVTPLFGGPCSVTITGAGVRRLMILFRNEVPSLEFIRLMPNLRALYLGCGLTTLVGIEKLTSLQSLAVRRVRESAVRSVQLMARLCDLRSLYIFIEYYRWFVAFRGVLPSLTSLTSLDVYTPAGARNNLIGAASRSLGGLTRLCLLCTSFTNTGDVWTDVHSDYELPSTQLRVLKLSATQPVHWWSGSAPGLQSVTELLLDDTDYNRPSCHGLLSMTALRSLTLRNLCAVSLVPLPSLTRLEISHCRCIVDMTSIVALTDLVELRVRSCGRAVMPPLTGLLRLKVLEVDDGTSG